jgi:hypothetical protein
VTDAFLCSEVLNNIKIENSILIQVLSFKVQWHTLPSLKLEVSDKNTAAPVILLT